MDVIAPFPAIVIMQKIGQRKSFIIGLLLISLNMIAMSTFGYTNLSFINKYLIITYKIIFSMLVNPVL